MAKSKVNTFFTVGFYLLVICAVAFVVGLVITFANNGQQDFYVVYGGAELSKEDSLTLPSDSYLLFYCKYVIADQSKGYDVKIVPASSAPDFDFYLNGEPCGFKNETELTSGFILNRYDGYFSLYLQRGFTMRDVLAKAYEGEIVTDVPDVDLTSKEYFALYVTSGTGEMVYIKFKLESAK